ncbi:uncharacterized protein TEOVI_000612400 [Trypanosoma equiperdum]|uniref:Uncharacterized protein n=1 Tax=Trypanosoma equiperdum TaxID=5694 RepID=A0A1G4I764_TRYEQ|nr:hypothetical protein, conserved [Trypanosoma equiperdum]
MRWSAVLCKVSKVPTRSVIPADALCYHPRYSVPRKMVLSNTFNVVGENNRYTSLKLILEKLSGHVGRRQYKMLCNLEKHYDKLKDEGIDWHELKWLSREELIVLFDKVLHLTRTERAALLPAIEAKVCGVLRQTDSRHSTVVCMNRGNANHGWRCGRNGHTNDVYFEGKAKANTAALQLCRRSSVRSVERSGVLVEVRSEPDFSVVGRFDHSLSPRVWSTPENPTFQVTTIGYEFRVHREDPRVIPQIVEAAEEWELHANITKQVIWEMLEMYAVERDRQPLDLKPGEMGDPDIPSRHATAFNVQVVPPSSAGDEAIQVVEQRIVRADGSEVPWFQEPPPQLFSGGIPVILPFAPSIIVKSTFRQVTRSSAQDVTRQLLQPVVDVTCFLHPNVCFWWNAEDEQRCLGHIVDYAKRIPFALPFNLYFRVNLSKDLRGVQNYSEELGKRMSMKAHYFNLRSYGVR